MLMDKKSFDFKKYDNPYELERANIIKGMLPLGQGGTAIDIGCGPGYFTRELSYKGWKTTAIDNNNEHVESVKTYASETYLGDVLSVLSRLPGDQHELVLSLEIIEHMSKDQGKKLLNEINRVLKKNGVLVISTPNRFSPEGLGGYYYREKIRRLERWNAWDPTHVHIYSSIEILKYIKAAGFIVDKIIGYYYEGCLPLIGHWKLPIVKSTLFPLNYLGFNILIKCHKLERSA